MIRNSITGKLWLLLVSLVVVSILAISFSLHQLLGSYYYRQQMETMLSRGEMLARSLASNKNGGNLSGQADILGKVAGTGVMIIDHQGMVISCSDIDTGMGMHHWGEGNLHVGWPVAGMHLDGEEVRQVLAGNNVVKRGYQKTFDAYMLTVAVPVKVNGIVTGAVMLFAREASLSAAMEAMDRLIIYAALVAVFLATILALIAARRITRPLKLMNQVALQMAAGDFSGRVPVTSKDELGRFADSFNNLSRQLAQTVAALSREKEKLNRVVRGMTDGVLAFELDGRTLFSNPQAGRLLKIPLPPGILLPAELLEPLLTAVKGEGETEEIKWRQQVISVRAASLQWEDRKRQAAVAILQDITEKKQLEQLRREFLASVSHELRTPLTFIQGYAEAMADGLAAGVEERRDYANIILEEAKRLRRLVDDLFDLNKISAGHLSLDIADVDIAELADRVAQKYRSVMDEHKLSLDVDVTEPLPILRADAGRLEQVLSNLLDNACRHTPPGGQIRITAAQAGKELKVCVSDTGKGIPAEELPHIWERFYKIDKSRARSDGGSGLGLSIVKSLVEAHGGRLEATSTPGKGSIFSFYLPIQGNLG